MTACSFLLTRKEFSAFHRLLSDEIWHHYEGASLLIHVIDPQGGYSVHRLGSHLRDIQAAYHVAIPRACWMAAELADSTTFDYAYIGLCMAPGFTFEEFELAERERLCKEYPEEYTAEVITRLTRLK